LEERKDVVNLPTASVEKPCAIDAVHSSPHPAGLTSGYAVLPDSRSMVLKEK